MFPNIRLGRKWLAGTNVLAYRRKKFYIIGSWLTLSDIVRMSRLKLQVVKLFWRKLLTLLRKTIVFDNLSTKLSSLAHLTLMIRHIGLSYTLQLITSKHYSHKTLLTGLNFHDSSLAQTLKLFTAVINSVPL